MSGGSVNLTILFLSRLRLPERLTSTSCKYRISSVIDRIIFLPKQSQRSRSALKDGSRSLGLFRKGKIGIIAKFIGLI